MASKDASSAGFSSGASASRSVALAAPLLRGSPRAARMVEAFSSRLGGPSAVTCPQEPGTGQECTERPFAAATHASLCLTMPGVHQTVQTIPRTV